MGAKNMVTNVVKVLFLYVMLTNALPVVVLRTLHWKQSNMVSLMVIVLFTLVVKQMQHIYTMGKVLVASIVIPCTFVHNLYIYESTIHIDMHTYLAYLLMKILFVMAGHDCSVLYTCIFTVMKVLFIMIGILPWRIKYQEGSVFLQHIHAVMKAIVLLISALAQHIERVEASIYRWYVYLVMEAMAILIDR